MDDFEREIYDEIRGKCVSDAAAERAAILAAEIAAVRFKATDNQNDLCRCGTVAVHHYCAVCWHMEIDAQKQMYGDECEQ